MTVKEASNKKSTNELNQRLKELEERIKQLEDKVFNTWLDQYQMQPKFNWYNYNYQVDHVDYVGPVSKYNPEFNKETR